MYTSNRSSPLIVSSGTWQDILLAWKTAFLALSNNPWKEVTGSSPTPTFLQPYASTAVAAATTYGNDKHVTFYLETDPGLALGSPVAKLFRIVAHNYALKVFFIDTATASPATVANWMLMGYAASTNNTNDYNDVNYYRASFASSIDGSAASNPTNSGINPLTFYMDVWEDMMYLKTEANGQDRGGILLFYPEEIPGGQIDRGEFPFIWALHSGYSGGTVGPNHVDADDVATCAWGSTIATYNSTSTQGPELIGWVPELGFVPSYPDTQNREYLQRIAFYANQATGSTFWSGLNGHIRVSRSGMATSRGNIRVIDSVNHLEIKSFNGAVWYLRLADNNA